MCALKRGLRARGLQKRSGDYSSAAVEHVVPDDEKVTNATQSGWENAGPETRYLRIVCVSNRRFTSNASVAAVTSVGVARACACRGGE